jgi:Mismatch repair ATPase (MutS family)
MRERTYSDLELDKVFTLIKRHSLTEKGEALFNGNCISTDEEVINKRADYVDEVAERLVSSTVRPTRFCSLEPLFDYVEATHAAIDGTLINSFSDYLASLKTLSLFLEKEEIFNPYFDTIISEVRISLDSSGDVLETHPLVAPAVRKLEEEKARRFRFSQSYISENRDAVQNVNPVYRNERVAIPVRAEAKSTVKGYVQGTSSSGSTFFIEPFELVEINNSVILSEDEIRRAKQKVLFNLSEKVRQVLPSFRKIDAFVTDFDFHYSLAVFAREFKMERVKSGKTVSLIDARHPLLGESAVPVTLSLDENIRALVLSGANAGGKTVTMKTVALLSVLNQIDAHIPASANSTLPLFENIYTDIGDGQSIEESVSTFSSHMKNVASILRQAKERDLVLLDELGTGTDPEEGAALSVSIIDRLRSKAALTIITSHYVQVKRHAYAEEGILNASMEFSGDSNKPTYRIIAGLPGDSHALEIAASVGIEKAVIAASRAQLSSESNSIAKIIADLKGKTRALDRKITENELEKRRLEKENEALKAEKAEFEREKFEIRKQKADELSLYLASSRREFDALLKELKKTSTDKNFEKARSRTKTFVKALEDKKTSVEGEIEHDEEFFRIKPDKPYAVGDEVLCGVAKKRGVLLESRGKGKWLVGLDSMRIVLKEDNFQPAGKEKAVTVSPYALTTEKPVYVLDVRGLTLAESIEKLESQIESCLVHNLSSFSIIHGFGDGILSRGIREYLKKRKEVKSFEFARPEDGGMGKTYVVLS